MFPAQKPISWVSIYVCALHPSAPSAIANPFERAATWNEEPMKYRQINRAIDMADGEYGGKSKLPTFWYVDSVKSRNTTSHSMLEGGDILIRIRPSTSLKYKAVAEAVQCQKQRTKREGKQCSKAQDSFGMTTGDHRIGSRKWTDVKKEESQKEINEIEITHREKKTPKHA